MLPEASFDDVMARVASASPGVRALLESCLEGEELSLAGALALEDAQGEDLNALLTTADVMRQRQAGDTVTYVVNRNINFTNVCIKRCRFCAFSRTSRSTEGYLLPPTEIAERARQAQALGATEICVQAGLVPSARAQDYLDIMDAIRDAAPGIHLHAWSPEEIKYGASLAGFSTRRWLETLMEHGLGSIPGTSAEILDEALRQRLAPGRIPVSEWVDIVKTAHGLGIPTTSTMMFGHLETPSHRVRHLDLLRRIQKETGGFTEFVPLVFVPQEAPMTTRGLFPNETSQASSSLSLRVHAIARLFLGPTFRNIQVSWVKHGLEMAARILKAGANDLGGTLMNESISTAAGSTHGQFASPSALHQWIHSLQRIPGERTMRYQVLRRFAPGEASSHPLDAISDGDSRFGTYAELTQSGRFPFPQPPRRVVPPGPADPRLRPGPRPTPHSG